MTQPFTQSNPQATKPKSSMLLSYIAIRSKKDLKLERSSGDIALDVFIRARIRFKVGLLKTKHRTLRVSCSPVLVNFSKAKSFERAYCDVEM